MSIKMKLFDVKELDFSEEFEKLANEASEKMKSIVVKDTGDTANSIRSRVTNHSYEIYGTKQKSGKKMMYKWHLIEFGAPTISATPFVRPTAKMMKQKNEDAIKRVIEKSVKLK